MDLNVPNNKKPNSLGLVNSNKWSISNLFWNKKSKSTETSSEEDRITGSYCTAAVQPETKYKNKKQTKIDKKYILRLKNKNKSFDQKLILGTIAINSLDQRVKKVKNKTIFTSQCESSSNEEIISPKQIEKYPSDDSFGSGKNEANIRSFTTRRSRTARNERYFKRLSRDDGSMGYGHTIEIHSNLLKRSLNIQQNPNGMNESSHYKLKTSSSLTHLPNQQNSALNNFNSNSNCLNFDKKRSISYDNQIHFKKEPAFFKHSELKLYTEPPIPPPRNSIRQFTTSNLPSECRPISYAFDQNTLPYIYSPINKRCNSDDKIWVSSSLHQSPILNQRASISELQDNQTVTNKHRRFIKRSERNSQTSKRSCSSELDFQYIAEATPRSRKPIATIEKQTILKSQQITSPLSSSPVRVTKKGILTPLPITNVSNFLQNIDNRQIQNCQRSRDTKTLNKYCKKNAYGQSFLNSNTYNNSIERINNKQVACSKTVLNREKDKNPVENCYNHKIESISKSYGPKNSSVGMSSSLNMPLHKLQKLNTAHDKYVKEKINCNNMEPLKTINLSESNISTTEKKRCETPSKNATNLEDAINELETICVSLNVSDDLNILQQNFEKFVKYTDEYNDDEETRCSPDIIRDDVVYRNLKHSNKISNHFEKQRPFGIPVAPIAFSSKSDYLQGKINNKKSLHTTPDIFFDDLAVRSLRKDSVTKQQSAYPSISVNKKRATRTQSANIYSLIHRNSAKPSGGNLSDYDSEKINSKYDSKLIIPDDISLPTNYNNTDFHLLKERIENRATLSLPRTSLISEFEKSKNMEDALNRIAKDAKESSAQLNRDLFELRKGTSKVQVTTSTLSKPKYDTSFVDIGSVPGAIKKYEKFTINQLQKALTPSVQVFNEANEKNLINNQTNFKVNKKEKNTHVLQTDLTMPSLIEKLDPKLFDNIGIIAARCMHQISELSELTDHSADKLNENYNKTFITDSNRNLSHIKSSNSNLSHRNVLVPKHKEKFLDTKLIEEEEIDKIMKECEIQARLDLLSMENSKTDINSEEIVEVKTPLCLTNKIKPTSPLISQCLLSNIISTTPSISRSNTELLPITGEIELNSVTSFDTNSTSSITPNLPNLPLIYDLNTSSSSCNLTPIGNELASCQSEYNSSDELAMIFGIEKSLTYDSSHKLGSTAPTENLSRKLNAYNLLFTANSNCQPISTKRTSSLAPNASTFCSKECLYVGVPENYNYERVFNSPSILINENDIKPLKLLDLKYPDLIKTNFSSNNNERQLKELSKYRNSFKSDSHPITALYDIICKEQNLKIKKNSKRRISEMDAIANNSTSTDNDDPTILPILHHASQKLNQDCNVPTTCYENKTNVYKVDVETSPSLLFSNFTSEIDNKLVHSKAHIKKNQSGTLEDTDKQQNTICDSFYNSKLLTSSSQATENRLKSTPKLVLKQYDCLKSQTQSFENQKKNKYKKPTKSNQQPLNVMSEKSNGNDSQTNINIEKCMPKQLLLSESTFIGSHDDQYSVQSSNVDPRDNGNHQNINENINNCKSLTHDHLSLQIHPSFNQGKEDPSLFCRTDFDKKVELTKVAQFDVSDRQSISPVNSSKTNKNSNEINDWSPQLINGRIIATSIKTQCKPIEKKKSIDFSFKTKKLVPTATISIKQNLNELNFNGSQSILTSKKNTKYNLPLNSKALEEDSFTLNNNSSEYILKPNKLPTVVPSTSEISKSIYKFPLAIEADDDFHFGRLRSSTMISNSKNLEAMIEHVQCQQLNLSPDESSIIKPEERDKSSERKSNLNRGSRKETKGEELDRSFKLRQRHRGLISSEQSFQANDNPSEITDVLSPLKDLQIEQMQYKTDIDFTTSEFIPNSFPVRKRYNSSRNGRRVLDEKIKMDDNFEMPQNQSTEIHNINNDKDASLSEFFIRKPKNSSLIVEENDLTFSENVINFKDRICKCLEFSNLVDTQQIEQTKIDFQSGSCNQCALKRERISFVEDLNYGISQSSIANQFKTLKPDKQFPPDQPSVFPILRRKSSEDQFASTNHIVSILKKKDNVDQSSSTSSNASPVTFSSSVVDTPIRNGKRQGILKKRSSLDESRYYSRSHSPDERSILVKSIRRNSLEDIQPGILKQSSYEIKNDGFVSSNDSQPHGILKKKDSLSTPSESQQNAKHVSISQAVILAAAELCKDISNSASSPNSNNSDYEIRSILKADCPEIRTPKPILKKKSSSDFEEIRPILKTSRKSSREESDTEDQNKRPILKTESPSKHRSISLDTNAINLSLSETSIEPKSVESQILSSNHQDNPIISVAERIKNMELFINRYKATNSESMSTNLRQNVGRREIIRNRFRTQPITNEEINCFQIQQVDQLKPSTSFYHLNKSAPATVEFQSDTSFAVNNNLSLVSSTLNVSRPLNDFSNTLISNNSDLCVSNIQELSTSMDEISAKAQNSFLLDDSCLHQSTSPTMCENIGQTQASADSKMPSCVRTTANVFQQLDKIKVNCEDGIVSPSVTNRDATPRLSPQRNSILQMETPKCSSTPNEVDIEPSSLSLSERLRFFSNLTDNSSANSSLTKSSYENINKSNYHSIETTPKSSSSARIKFKHVGRVSYPSFLNDSNNNMNLTVDKNQNDNISINKETKIGKIKSPFIENNVNLRLSEKLTKQTLERSKDLYEENNSNGVVDCGKVKKTRKIFTSPSITTKPVFIMNSPNNNYFEEHFKTNESLDKENNLYSSIKQVRNQVPSLNKLPYMVNQTSLANEKIAKYFGILKHEKNSATRKPVDMIHLSNNVCTKNNLASKIIKDRNQRNNSFITEDEKLPHSQCITDDQLSNQMKRRELSKRNRAMTLIDNNSISFSNSVGYKNKKSTRAMTTDVGYNWKSNNFITKFEELKVTKEDLLLASKEFDRIFLGVV